MTTEPTAFAVTEYQIRDGAAWITLNRPERRNALSGALIAGVYQHLGQANADDDVRCIVITGNGPAFCAGADLKDEQGLPADKAVSYPQLLSAIQDSPKPVIAAINGAAFAGGLGLVGAADIVVSVDDVAFSFSEVRIGVIPAVISVVCVPKLGVHHAMKLFLSGERFSAAQAVAMGLVHRAVPKHELESAVTEEVEMICAGGPNAVIECKKLVRRVATLSREEGFAETEPWSQRLFASAEGQEGMAAFREKRPAAWIRDN